MDHKDTLKLLQKLTQLKDAKADIALEKALDKIISIINNSFNYQDIDNQLERLKVISYRLSDKALIAYKSLITRLNTIQFEYKKEFGMTEENYRVFYTPARMIGSILEDTSYIRYHQPEEILKLFLSHSNDVTEQSRNSARNGLKELSKYHISIIYGKKGTDWKGLGFGPQKLILDHLEPLPIDSLKTFLTGVNILLSNILSPTMEDSWSDYRTVTLESGELPADKQLIEIRRRAISILQKIYREAALTITEKLSLLTSLNHATRGHHSNESNEFYKIIQNDTKNILKFYLEILPNEDLEIMQHIEEDAYWLFRHHGSTDQEINNLALQIQQLLWSHPEFSIYRMLIGFRNVYDEWISQSEDKEEFSSKYNKREEWRTQQVNILADSISEDNYAEWEARILEYAKTKSDDRATFPFFGKFIERFSEKSPTLALRLITGKDEELQRFLPAFIFGLLKSDKASTTRLLYDWINSGKHLFQIAKSLSYLGPKDEELLSATCSKALEKNDLNALVYVISTTVAGYDSTKRDLVAKFFTPTITKFTEFKDTRWIFDLWYRPELEKYINGLTEDALKAILNNLVFLHQIDDEAEKILGFIAAREPKAVLELLKARLEEGSLESTFDAIPYEFHNLGKALSYFPKIVVGTTRQWFTGNYDEFIYGGGRLVSNIFPTFSEPLETELMQLLEGGSKEDILYILSILRNYDGEEALHNICKALVDKLPEDDELLNSIGTVIKSTGVVHGEFGYAEAQEQRKDYLKKWLPDPRPKVHKFASELILNLEDFIIEERQKTEEDILLSKHKYGDDS